MGGREGEWEGGRTCSINQDDLEGESAGEKRQRMNSLREWGCCDKPVGVREERGGAYREGKCGIGREGQQL